LHEWFENKEKEMSSSRGPEQTGSSWGVFGSMDDDDLYLEVQNEDRDPEWKAREEARIKAEQERERVMILAMQREAEMDLQAEKRRAAEQRRLLNQMREELREVMIFAKGSAKEAFNHMDTTNSGKICMNEFQAAMKSFECNWEEITGYDNIRKVFQLFDHDRKGYIVFANLFPLDAKAPTSERMSTPEFWDHWCKMNRDVVKASKKFEDHAKTRCARYEPEGPGGMLDLIANSRREREQINDKKKWMKGMIRRLKFRGKSDARCREITALHLPRGSGPRDLQDVQTFSEADVSACRKAYAEKVQDSVRSIEKTVFDMHDQKRELHKIKHQLFATTEEPHLLRLKEEAARASLIGGLGLANTGGLSLSKYHDSDDH